MRERKRCRRSSAAGLLGLCLAVMIPTVITRIAAAEEAGRSDIVYVDAAEILAQSTVGQAEQQRLEHIYKVIQTKIQSRQDEIKKLEGGIDFKNLSDETAGGDDPLQRLDEDARRLGREIEDMEAAFKQELQKSQEKLLQRLDNVLRDYSEEANVALIFDRRAAAADGGAADGGDSNPVLYARPEFRMTAEILKRFDAQGSLAVDQGSAD